MPNNLQITVGMDDELAFEFNSIRNRIKAVKLESEILKSQNYVMKHKVEMLEKEVSKKDLFINVLLMLMDNQVKEIQDLESAIAEIYDSE